MISKCPQHYQKTVSTSVNVTKPLNCAGLAAGQVIVEGSGAGPAAAAGQSFKPGTATPDTGTKPTEQILVRCTCQCPVEHLSLLLSESASSLFSWQLNSGQYQFPCW